MGRSFAPRLDAKRKIDIIGILMLVCGILLLLALVSYSSADESVADIGIVEFFKIFSGDPEIQARADVTANWLGLLGALIARFFVHSTIGMFALSFPVLLCLWGWFLLRDRDLKVLAYYTNYALLLVFLCATFFGLLRLVTWMPDISVVWAGNIGDFIAGVLARLIGVAGALIALAATIVILAIIVVDYDIRVTLERLRSAGQWTWAKLRGKSAAWNINTLRAETDDTDDEPQAPEPVVQEVKPVARQKPDRDIKSPTEPLPPRTLPVSINRSDFMEPIRSEIHVPLEDGMRSSGVIPRDSIPELRSLTSDFNPIPDRPLQNSESVHKIESKSIEQPKSESPRSLQSNEPQLINEHERSTMKQAVVQRVSESYSDIDPEDVNSATLSEALVYHPPSPDILDAQINIDTVTDSELRLKAELVKEKLAVFGIEITGISVIPGPVVTQFELVPDSSVKISKIVALADDLALALAARGIRIIAPIPGKSAVGIEIPNNAPEIVRFRSIVSSPIYQKNKALLPLALGKSITGDVFCDDLTKMPHLLVAGATGAGKSVGINVMINSLLFKMHPSDVKFVMIDPKKIELAQYRDLSKHFLAVCPDINEEIITDPANAVIVLKSLELEMDNRYTKLAKAGVRHITDYNAKVKSGALRHSETLKHYRLPYIVVVIDELADLMITAAREVEEPIARLAQLARAVGIHLVLATQRPSVDVITGVIKANFPARIAYQVASRIDSRTILDAPGADQLLGNGDMLYLPSGFPKPVRIQNAYLSTAEVERVVESIASQNGFVRPYLLPSVRAGKKNQSREDSIEMDELLVEAARLVVRHQQGSVSLLQRRLKIGYSRAARIVDQLEMAGIVGPYDGSKAREVLVEDEAYVEEMLHQTT